MTHVPVGAFGSHVLPDDRTGTRAGGTNPPSHNTKIVATLAAQFALRGHEMRTIRKGGREYYEVRRSGQARNCSTAHDLRGFLAQIGGAP